MTIKLLTKNHLEFQSLKEGYTSSSESTLVNGNHMSRINKCKILIPKAMRKVDFDCAYIYGVRVLKMI